MGVRIKELIDLSNVTVNWMNSNGILCSSIIQVNFVGKILMSRNLSMDERLRRISKMD
jgi:hypothetical protein